MAPVTNQVTANTKARIAIAPRGAAEPWSLTNLREKLIKIGAKVVSHARYVTLQMAAVAVPPRQMFAAMSLIARLRVPPAPHERRCENATNHKGEA
jgi:hypothetical protein